MRYPVAVEAFTVHLEKVRRLSPATVRAYRNDLRDLGDGVAEMDLAEIDLEHLREWLWRATQRGDARSTLARRAAAARSFFAWAKEEEHIPADPSLRLVTPKRSRTLPVVASQLALTDMLDAHRERAAQGDPIALRDSALLELLYGSGIRVSELCGLDVDDLDTHRATARVLGKGSKERVVPFGRPALDAVTAYLTRARPALAARGRMGVRRCCSAPGAVDWRPARCTAWCRRRSRRSWAPRPSDPTRCAIPPRRTSSTGALTCAPCRRSSGTPASARRRSTRTCRRSASPPRTRSRTPAPEPAAPAS